MQRMEIRLGIRMKTEHPIAQKEDGRLIERAKFESTPPIETSDKQYIVVKTVLTLYTSIFLYT